MSSLQSFLNSLSFEGRVARWFIFKPKIQIWEGLKIENICIFYGHLENIIAVWYIKWPFGNLVLFGIPIFPRFGILYDEKSGNPA
jgi:hypothetical protein